MNRHENQTMKIFGKRLTAGLLGAALVMSMPFASALTQKNITVGRGVTIYVNDRKLNPGDANGNPVEPMLYNGTTYLPIRAVSAALNVPIAWDGTTSSAYLGEHKVDQNAVNRAKAYVSVIEQLQSKYGKRAVSGSIISGLVTAMLIDFDGDGNEELLCVCNTKEKIPADQWDKHGTNASSKYMVYAWNGYSAVKLVEDEVPFIFTQNDSRNFPRSLEILSRDGKKYLFWQPAGEWVAWPGTDGVSIEDQTLLSKDYVETIVDSKWQISKGYAFYDVVYKVKEYLDNGVVLDYNTVAHEGMSVDLVTGKQNDYGNASEQMHTWLEQGTITQYRTTLYNADFDKIVPSNLAPAPEIALSKLKAIANSQSSILGGKASSEYTAKRRTEKLTVQTGIKVYVNDKQIVPTDVNGKTVDVLLYKGTTYLPVRAVANALDQAVAWDGASYSVYIGSHKDV